MKVHEASLCSDCPVWARMREAPEIANSEPVQQVIGYIDDFVDYRDSYINYRVGLDADLQEVFGKDYLSSGTPCDADEGFVRTAHDTKGKILAYLDLLPTDISVETTLELGRCAHMLAAGSCAHSGMIPRYAEKLAEMRGSGEVA